MVIGWILIWNSDIWSKTTMNRRYAMASLAVMAANLKLLQGAKAQTQVIHNGSQVVSTGDVVISQSAGGQQYVWDDRSQSWQAISNDAQIVATGNVTVDQSAAGTQVDTTHGVGTTSYICTPGEFYEQGNCVVFCGEDGCSWNQFCCQERCCGKDRGWKQQIGGKNP